MTDVSIQSPAVFCPAQVTVIQWVPEQKQEFSMSHIVSIKYVMRPRCRKTLFKTNCGKIYMYNVYYLSSF